MMKDIEIKINRETRMVDLSKSIIGNDGENLQGNLVFSFTDGFVKGQGRLEYVTNREKKYALLLKGEDNYYIPIKSVMTKEGQIDMQLVITEGTDTNEIPIFKSNVFYVTCKGSINAEIEEEEGYYQWIEIANTKLNKIDEVVEEVETKLENGEFNGKDGKDFTYEDFTEEQLENLRGPQGIPGEPGEDGKDYVLTEADKQEIAANLNEENDERITENENDIVDIESYLDNLTPKNTAKGELVHITDALGLPTFETKTSGNVEQFTTTGKNIAKSVKNEPATGQFISILYIDLTDLKPSETYTIGFIAPANCKLYFNENLFKWKEIVGTGTFQIYTITTLETLPAGQYYGNKGWLVLKNNSGNTVNSVINDVILVEGVVSDLTYEPYTGGQASPNPDYPQEIEVLEGDLSYKVNGKNLFDLNYAIEKNYYPDGTETSLSYTIDNNGYLNNTATNANIGIKYLNKIALKAGTYTLQYVLNLTTTGERVVMPRVKNFTTNTVIFNTNIFDLPTSDVSKNVTFTLSEDSEIGFAFTPKNGTSTLIIKDIQLEKGSIVTEIEPYQEQIVPLDLKGNFIGKIKDTDIEDYLVTDKKKFWLVKNTAIREYSANDVTKMTFLTYDNIDYARFLKPTDFITYGTNANTKVLCDSAYWDNLWYNFSDAKNIGRIIISAEGNFFWIGFPKGTTEEEMKEKLSNFKILYPTKEPEIIELGELPEPIKTFEGTNNIQLLANLDTEIEVTYALDIKKYTDNKLAEISAQII